MRRIIQLMALLALLLAPAGMLGSHAAMAMPRDASATMMDHCTDEQAPSDKDRQSMIDCALACSALPAAEPRLEADEMVALLALLTGPAPVFEGALPELATPPPRLS